MPVTPFSLSVFDHLFRGITEEMGTILARSAFSPNIRERLDFSCALFDPRGELLAQAAHIPVHLGSMPLLVRKIAGLEWADGDIYAANDPYTGGTHLPDITLVMPCFHGGRMFGFAAARAHHADVGGMSPGSMPRSREVYQEGLILPPVRLFRGGRRVEDLWQVLLANVRTPAEREGDLLAQVASCRAAAQRLGALLERYGAEELALHQEALLEHGERSMRAALRELPQGQAESRDTLELPLGEVELQCRISLEGEQAVVDLRACADSVEACVNAPLPVTQAAVYYVFRLLLGARMPANGGAFRALQILTRPGSVVDPLPPAPVVAGNVETSQRIVDLVMQAMARLLPERVPACSAGTMNNLALGGLHDKRPFAYYETLGGGCGGGPGGPGESGVQVHMTNTRNTPAEALEVDFPLRVRRYALRTGSGGEGEHPGGEGVIRELEFLAPVRATLLAQRRRRGAPGLGGAADGAPGRQTRIREGREEPLEGWFEESFEIGDRLRLETPGGGGWSTGGVGKAWTE